ncbi:hypothetical protein CRYUN_Cryun26dG0125000 [Craigia yunnanensis]
METYQSLPSKVSGDPRLSMKEMETSKTQEVIDGLAWQPKGADSKRGQLAADALAACCFSAGRLLAKL